MPAARESRVDYLAVPGPHGDWFPRLGGARGPAGYELPAGRVAEFRANGFVHAVPILDQRQVARLREGLDAIIAGRNGREKELLCRTGEDPKARDVVTYMQGAWMIDEAIHDLAFHPAITVKAAQLLGVRRVRFWHDQVFAKPAGHGGNVAWHQDYSYWKRTRPAQHLTCWIGLDDSTLENGCVHAVPGSHRWGLFAPDQLMGDMEALRRQLPAERVAQFRPVPLEQPTGTCSFHHDHTIHGSYRNGSARPRRAIVLNFMADGTVSDADDGVLMPGATPVAKGEPVRGAMFPLVVDLDVR